MRSGRGSIDDQSRITATWSGVGRRAEIGPVGTVNDGPRCYHRSAGFIVTIHVVARVPGEGDGGRSHGSAGRAAGVALIPLVAWFALVVSRRTLVAPGLQFSPSVPHS